MTSSTDLFSSSVRPSLWRHHDCRRYLTGQAAGVTGSSVSNIVILVLAVLELDATTAEVAWLMFLGQLHPALLVLYAGALADRHSERKQMITGDLVSAATLANVPVAVPGRPLHGTVLTPGRERAVFRRIGALARRIHQSSPPRPAPAGSGPAVGKADLHLAGARSHLLADDEEFVRELVRQAETLPPLEWVETHGDFQLRNILTTPDRRRTSPPRHRRGARFRERDLLRRRPR